MFSIGTSSDTNQLQQFLGLKTTLAALPFLGGARDTISSYADSPMLAYKPDNWQQSMRSYEDPINSQLSYKLKDIGSQMGREYHSFGRKLAQAGAQSDATNQLSSISSQRLSNERGQQANDWQNALAMQNQARSMDLGSLMGMIQTPTQSNSVVGPKVNIGSAIGNIGNLMGGIGSMGGK